jgi:hypothetical protein
VTATLVVRRTCFVDPAKEALVAPAVAAESLSATWTRVSAGPLPDLPSMTLVSSALPAPYDAIDL